MSPLNKNKILVTHNGTFHADDIFATATLSLLLDGNIEVIRTRDEEIIQTADYVYDVGGEYDPDRNRFDHHQKGGAGARENGIPYAAFGLVWRTYGEKLCGSSALAQKIDEYFIQSIDANDNGISTYEVNDNNIGPITIENIFSSFRPTYNEPEEYDAQFLELVEFAKKVLQRKIIKAQAELQASTIVEEAYTNASDKRVILLDGKYPFFDTLFTHPEPLYVVAPGIGTTWRVMTINKENKSFENRKSLPESWAGLRDQELAIVTGVPDATFCHNGRFLAVAGSREGALKLAELAVLA